MSVIFDTKPQFFSSSANEKQPLASKMAQELKEPATKPDNKSLMPENNIKKGNQFSQVVL